MCVSVVLLKPELQDSQVIKADLSYVEGIYLVVGVINYLCLLCKNLAAFV